MSRLANLGRLRRSPPLAVARTGDIENADAALPRLARHRLRFILSRRRPAAGDRHARRRRAPPRRSTASRCRPRRRRSAGSSTSTRSESTPWWPPTVVPPKGAPNVLLIMTDDAGYGVSGTFGGVIPTPTLDALAADGLRYTQFHSTALCSPTRAALITGRNHHSAGFGVIAEQATGFPGYDFGHRPGQRHDRQHPQGPRLRHLVDRQEPQHPDLRDLDLGAVRPVAVRHGLRLFLRLHGRRIRPVDAVAVPRPHPDLPVERQPQLQHDHRHGGRRHQLPARGGRRGAGEALLHVLRARAPPMRRTSRPRSGSTSSRASSTWAGTPCATRSSPTRSGSA